uniref:Uncharacterized protein n=1 Tax=Arundo donax TaxID=35708 RepID=A0A0A9FKD0_ARUDO
MHVPPRSTPPQLLSRITILLLLLLPCRRIVQQYKVADGDEPVVVAANYGVSGGANGLPLSYHHAPMAESSRPHLLYTLPSAVPAMPVFHGAGADGLEEGPLWSPRFTPLAHPLASPIPSLGFEG